MGCLQVGDLDSLLKECRSIQQHLPSSAISTALCSGQITHHFKLMMEGKLRAAYHLIGDNADSFPLSLNSKVFVAGAESSVRDVLLGKHQAGHLPKPSVSVSPSTTLSAPPFHLVLFDCLDGSLICCTILRMDGAAEPSGMDVASWRKLYTLF